MYMQLLKNNSTEKKIQQNLGVNTFQMNNTYTRITILNRFNPFLCHKTYFKIYLDIICTVVTIKQL